MELCLKACLLRTYVSLLLTAETLSVQNDLPRRSIVFEDFSVGISFPVKALKSFQNIDKTHCAMLCSFLYECLSFIYCASALCQLNTVDVFSTGVQTAKFDHTCTYHGMNKNETAVFVGKPESLGFDFQGFEWGEPFHKVRLFLSPPTTTVGDQVF